MAAMQKAPEIAGVFSSFQVNVPQLFADIDRTKAHAARRARDGRVQHAADLSRLALRQRLQQVWPHLLRSTSQADAPFRARADDIRQLKVRIASGDMVPLRRCSAIRQSAGPDRAIRYNGFLSSDINAARRARLFIRPGAGGRDADRGGDVAARLCLRMDRPDLSGVHRRQFRPVGVPAGDPAGVPGAGRAL